jgi:hypothetical protein
MLHGIGHRLYESLYLDRVQAVMQSVRQFGRDAYRTDHAITALELNTNQVDSIR